jgi:hypothetical protein
MGASYGAAARGTRRYDEKATYTFDLAGSRSLSLGLLSFTGYGGGFDSLLFTVKSGSTTLVSNSFTSFSAAQTYFTDHSLNLGTFAAGTTSIVIDFNLVASSAKGADFSYLLSSLTPVAARTTRHVEAGPVRTPGGPAAAVTAGLQPGMAGSPLVSRLPATSMHGTANAGAIAAPHPALPGGGVGAGGAGIASRSLNR